VRELWVGLCLSLPFSEASFARLLCSDGAFVCVALDWLASWRWEMGSLGGVPMYDDDCVGGVVGVLFRSLPIHATVADANLLWVNES
jgi:hypothetical protein